MLFISIFYLNCSLVGNKQTVSITPVFTWPMNRDNLPNFPGISSTFGESRTDHFHNGLDIVGKEGTPLGIMYSSEILYSYDLNDEFEQRERGTGNILIMDHGSGWWSAYYHLKTDSIKKRVGRFINLDEEGIAELGNTGRSSGAHLHFTISKDYGRTLVNPLSLLPTITDNNPPMISNLIIVTQDVITNLRQVSEEDEDTQESIENKNNKKGIRAIRDKKKYKGVGRLESIRMTQNYPVYIEIFDSGLEKESHRGIDYIEWQINEQAKQSLHFDKIEYKGQKWLLGNKEFERVYYKRWYNLGLSNFLQGKNNISIVASDYHGNHSKAVYKFNVDREY